jgi:hypothetical protein
MVATLGRSKIDQLLPHLPAGAQAQLAAGLGSGGVLHGVPEHIVLASQTAFVYALQYGLRLGAAVALFGAVLAWTMIRHKTAVETEAESAQGAPVAPPAEPLKV